MPGKVNPTQAEALTMACAQVLGERRRSERRRRVRPLRAQRVQAPRHPRVPAERRLLADGARSFDEHCARGIEANERAHPRAARAIAHARHRARPAPRLRQGRRDREEGASGGLNAARGGARAAVRLGRGLRQAGCGRRTWSDGGRRPHLGARQQPGGTPRRRDPGLGGDREPRGCQGARHCADARRAHGSGRAHGLSDARGVRRGAGAADRPLRTRAWWRWPASCACSRPASSIATPGA